MNIQVSLGQELMIVGLIVLMWVQNINRKLAEEPFQKAAAVHIDSQYQLPTGGQRCYQPVECKWQISNVVDGIEAKYEWIRSCRLEGLKRLI